MISWKNDYPFFAPGAAGANANGHTVGLPHWWFPWPGNLQRLQTADPRAPGAPQRDQPYPAAGMSWPPALQGVPITKEPTYYLHSGDTVIH